jgi:hypothetical protein
MLNALLGVVTCQKFDPDFTFTRSRECAVLVRMKATRKLRIMFFFAYLEKLLHTKYIRLLVLNVEWSSSSLGCVRLSSAVFQAKDCSVL